MSAGDFHKLSGRNCVVTGGLGFIGSNLALRLADAGAEVTVIDALIPRHGGSPANLDERDIPVIVADIADSAAISSSLAHAEIIFNLAGQVSHVDSMEDPLGDLDINARSQLAFLELIRQVNLDATVVYASTRQIYGRVKYLPVDEEHPVNPIDVNGVDKYAAEQFHLLYAHSYGMHTTALRLSNIYGPRQRLLGDHLGFLPVFIRHALEGQPITLYGDGSQERDCLFVDDAVESFAYAALNDAAIGEVINIGHPQPLSLHKIADLITSAVGGGDIESIAWPRERERIDIGSYYGDYTKAFKLLGWEASTPFEIGIKPTVEFFRSRAEQYL